MSGASGAATSPGRMGSSVSPGDHRVPTPEHQPDAPVIETSVAPNSTTNGTRPRTHL
jgi:hypothetical protein